MIASSLGEAVKQAALEAKVGQDKWDSLFVHEVVLGGALERPLHHTEKMLEVTLRWGTWDGELGIAVY